MATEIEKLQKQICELQKEVDNLKSDMVKREPLRDRLVREQSEIFNRYFESKFDPADEYWQTEGFLKSGNIIANENRDRSRRAIRDLARSLYIINHFPEKMAGTNQLFEKMLRNEEQVQEYLTIFDELCKAAVAKVTNDKFKREG